MSSLLDPAKNFRYDPGLHSTGLGILSIYRRVELAEDLSWSCLFDGSWYCLRYNISGGLEEALDHYFDGRNDRKFNPHPLFDTRWYLETYPEAALSKMNPLAHYLDQGAPRGLAPHPLFQPDYYAAQGVGARSQLLIDYLADESNWGKRTHPLFDGGFYQRENPDVVQHKINPLKHYVQSGAQEGRRSCPLFWSGWYATTYPDVGSPERNPLVDYVTTGARQGRNPNVIFDSAWYLASNGDVASAGLNPLSHYVEAGASEGRDPSPLFDANWYQSRYPETNQRGVDPLEHYLRCGMEAGYQMRPADRITHDCDALDIPYEILRVPEVLAGREVCVFVTYAADGKVEDHVLTTMRSYKEAKLTLVLVVVTEGLNVALLPCLDIADGIIVRVNHGWDFAAWATALAVLPDLWSAKLLILVNDSLYGPTSQAGLTSLLEQVRASDKDIVALTDSYQANRHLMSYFTAITEAGLRNHSIRTFWNGIRSNRDKPTVIREYEMKSIERCMQNGATFDVLFPSQPEGESPGNPTLSGWKALCFQGFPFIKVQLLRDFADKYEAGDWAEYFAINPKLATQVKTHLASVRCRPPAATRPIPNPKQRFIQAGSLATYYGATTACRPSREVDLSLEVPFRDLDTDLALPSVVAVIAHVFYPDFCPVLLAALSLMPVRADLFVSTNTEQKSREIAKAFADYDGQVEIRICPNVGRDIAPMLVMFDDVFANYDVFLHLHSKRSPHQSDLAEWRDFLLTNLVGSRDTICSILHMFATQDVGIVFSQHFPPVRELINFGYNFEVMSELLGRCGIELSKDLVLEFPSSSFFWGRSAAVRPLLSLGLGWSDFCGEAGQVDGTLAHAIERSLLYVAEAAGFRWAKVADPRCIANDVLVPVHGSGDLATALARVRRPLLHNQIVPYKEACLVPEINRVLTYRDIETRPRLTLILPTLQPAKVFGGLTTAILLFQQLAKEFGDDVDLRIMSLTERVDMLSMLSLPKFRLVSIGAVTDAFPRVVLDASERQRGYVSVRRNDIFIATAWWTASAAFTMQDNQTSYFGIRHPLLYLIQDHEANFYSWSSHFQEAQQTYARPLDTIAILNSEELAGYLVPRYKLSDAYVVPFALNPIIKDSLSVLERERIVLVYGRPSVARNCFDALCTAIGRWQRMDPIEAIRWRIISVGEAFDPVTVSQIQNLEVLGKVSLQQYGDLLSRAAVGVSLMASPHPSYPPLEMAYAGLLTVTNAFEGKDLSRRSSNIFSVADLGAGTIAMMLAQAVRAATPSIGKIVPTSPLNDLACPVAPYNPGELALRLRALWSCHDEPAIAAKNGV